MRKVQLLILIFLGSTMFSPLFAQRIRKRPPKSENTQTPQNAIEKKEAEKQVKWKEYQTQKDQQKKIQDKATRKRMKQNLKYSRKQSWGKEIPWYRRVFRKKKF